MASNKINLSFTFKNGRFYVCAHLSGTPIRAYKVVPELIRPNYECWDRKKQLFMEATSTAIHNNDVLRKLRDKLEYLIDIHYPHHPKQLFDLYDMTLNTGLALTFGDYVIRTINVMKDAKNKRPSKNYQKYINLRNKLECIESLYNKPLRDIGNDDFISFGNYILQQDDKTKNNYKHLMKLFKSVHAKAVQDGLNSNSLIYRYMDKAPIKKAVKRIALTEKQYKTFVNYDLSKIDSHGINTMYYKELYRDFCIFMYESMMRPADIIKLHHNDIRNNLYIEYEPEKKKNYIDEDYRVTRTPLTKKMKRIIKKYSGKSSQGYVFPFSMNNYEWDMDDTKSWNAWQNRKQSQLEAINNFLHKFESILKASPITCYTFRHTTFTHAINDSKTNLIDIARHGGTSVTMLDRHYYHARY